MSSVNKKRKQVSMYCDGGSLKWKGIRGKRWCFFNSAQRHAKKKEVESLVNEAIDQLETEKERR